MCMEKNVVIIGAGIAGLASAIRFAGRGYRVEVFEKEQQAGGKMGELSWNGYRWDTGPSLFTLPGEVEKLYRLAGQDMQHYLPYTRLGLVTRYFWEDGTVLNSWGDPQRFSEEAEKVTGESSEKVTRYLEHKRVIYDLVSGVFIRSPFNRLSTYLSKGFRRALLQVRKIDPLRTMHEANSKWFASTHLVQLFDRYATYNGSDPGQAPATLTMIAHLEHSLGAFFPERGMYSIAGELRKLAEKLGVRFHFSSPVEQIILEGKQVRGIVSGGEKVYADLVISDVDIHILYSKLLPDVPFPRKYFSQPRSSSALIFYWAMDRKFPRTDLHNIFFAENYAEEFEYLFKRKEFYSDPTVYLYISSKKVSGDAPDNGENWFVMVNVPENNGQDWVVYTTKLREAVLQKLERNLGVSVRKHLLFEYTRDPVSIEEITGSWKGSLYGSSSNTRMAAFSRHPNNRRQLKNLYFAGGSVHPGGGIPLCLASAEIVDVLVHKK